MSYQSYVVCKSFGFLVKVTLKTDLDLVDDLELVTNRKVLSQDNTYVKYEGPNLYQSKYMANVKVFWTNK